MNYGVLLAGGMGTRLGLPTPKQFLKLGNKTLLEHTVEKFSVAPDLVHTVVVVPEAWYEQSKAIIDSLNLSNISICTGGKSRQESLYKGLLSISKKYDVRNDDIAVSHDVARPFVTYQMISDNIKICKKYGAADTVIPTADTIVESVNHEDISSVPIRQNMYLGQTPQTFYIKQFIEIYESLTPEYLENVTDAARILKDHGVRVGLAKGDSSNMKVTTLFDLQIANSILNQFSKQDLR